MSACLLRRARARGDGGIRWYFTTSGKNRVAVDGLVDLLVDAVQPVVEAAVVNRLYEGWDQWYGFVNQVNAADAPVGFRSVIEEARFTVAERRATPPTDIDLVAILRNARAEWGDGAVYLPVKVSAKPSQERLKEVLKIDFAKAVTGDAAFAEIDNFDAVILADVAAHRESIKQAWYITGRGMLSASSEEHGLIFLDDQNQLWGVQLFFPLD